MRGFLVDQSALAHQRPKMNMGYESQGPLGD